MICRRHAPHSSRFYLILCQSFYFFASRAQNEAFTLGVPKPSFTCPSLPLISLWLDVSDKLPSRLHPPPRWVFRFLMSLYLALLERRDVSFHPETHFSCHLGQTPYLPHQVNASPLPCNGPPTCIFIFQEILYDILGTLVEEMGAKEACFPMKTCIFH